MGPQHARGRVSLRTGLALTMWLAIVMGAAYVTSAVPAATGAPDLFDEIYKRSQPIDASLKTVHATFVETTTSPLLAKPLIAEGTLAAVRPSEIEMVYTKPERKTITIRDNQLVFDWPDRKLHQERDITEAQKRVQRYFVTRNPNELRRHFTIAAADDRTRPKTYLIDMTPKRKQIQEGLEHLQLWIRQDTLMLDAMRMTFPGGHVKLMEFHDVIVNKPAATP